MMTFGTQVFFFFIAVFASMFFFGIYDYINNKTKDAELMMSAGAFGFVITCLVRLGVVFGFWIEDMMDTGHIYMGGLEFLSILAVLWLSTLTIKLKSDKQ